MCGQKREHGSLSILFNPCWPYLCSYTLCAGGQKTHHAVALEGELQACCLLQTSLWTFAAEEGDWLKRQLAWVWEQRCWLRGGVRFWSGACFLLPSELGKE
jgi:hypothetical protein